MSAEKPIDGNATTKDLPAVEPRPTRELQPVQHGKSLAGFYIALGVVAALVGLAAWMWTPLRILYWERQVLRQAAKKDLIGQMRQSVNTAAARSGSATPYIMAQIEGLPEAFHLVDSGPQASTAVGRLLRSNNYEVRGVISLAIEIRKAQWALPLAVEAAKSQEPDVALNAILVAQRLSDWDFGLPPQPATLESRRVLPEVRKHLLDWWEREGQAKYGGGGK